MMPTVRTGPFYGLIFHILVLAALQASVGLGALGWVVGLSAGAFTCAALMGGLRQSGAVRLGLPNAVTLTRAGLAGGVAALTADSFSRPAPIAVLCALTAVALAMDAVDGQVARRTGAVSPLGARFDMETDAWLILVLSVYVAHAVGPWVVLIGLMRYLIGVATWLVPWLRGPIPPSMWRKTVAAMQGVALAVAASALLPALATAGLVAVSLAFLLESFGSEVVWRWRRRTAITSAVRAAAAAQPVRELVMAGSS
jgi:phosphatidylglycerophosphate synthase